MADQKDPGDHIQQHIQQCCICSMAYNTTNRKPDTTTCGNATCLQKLAESKDSTSNCPPDRSQIFIPSDEVSDLLTDFSFLRITDNTCDECHDKPKKTKCPTDHCQKSLCEVCFDDHCKQIEGSLKTSLNELRDEMNTLQAECDDDEDVQLLEEQCSETIEAVSLICDELKQHLEQGIKDRFVSDKETLFLKMSMEKKITNTKSVIHDSISKLSTATGSASSAVMGYIQKKVLSEKDNPYSVKDKPQINLFHPENLEQEFKAMLPHLLLILFTQLSSFAHCKVSSAGIPDYSSVDNTCDECHTKPVKIKCLLDHCQKILCEVCFGDHCRLVSESWKTSLKQVKDEMNTLKAKCDGDDIIQLLEEQCSEAIEAVSLICDEFKRNLVLGIKDRGISDKETLFKWKMNIGMIITNTNSFIHESISKLSTATGSATAAMMKYIQKKVLSEKDNIYSMKDKPQPTLFHPENLKQEFKAILPHLLLVLFTQHSAVAHCKVSCVGIPDYSSAKFKCMYGPVGGAAHKLNSPYGLCCSPIIGYLAIVDWLNHSIQVLNGNLKHLVTFGGAGNGENQFNFPTGITFNSKGNLFITDTFNHRIQITSFDGRYLSTFGTKGSGKGQYNEPWGISCDEDDLLYICDHKNYRVQIVKENGEFIRSIGCRGDNPGEFQFCPRNIVCSKVHDIILVTDKHCNLHSFTHAGRFIKMIKDGQPPYSMDAHSVAIDHVGNVIVGDVRRHRLVVLGPDGDLLSTIGGPGEGAGQFNQPSGITVTRDGCLYVSDSENHRVQLLHVPVKTQ